MHKLNLLVDNALIALIRELIESSKYEEASLVVNRLVLTENVKEALELLGTKLNLSKLKDSTCRKCLAILIADKAL